MNCGSKERSRCDTSQVILKASSEEMPCDNVGTALKRTCIKLLTAKSLVDCCLSCVDGEVEAHKLVLAASSVYLYERFTTSKNESPCHYPILFIAGASVKDVRKLLEFIYTGKTIVSKEQVASLQKISEQLGISLLSKTIEQVSNTWDLRSMNGSDNYINSGSRLYQELHGEDEHQSKIMKLHCSTPEQLPMRSTPEGASDVSEYTPAIEIDDCGAVNLKTEPDTTTSTRTGSNIHSSGIEKMKNHASGGTMGPEKVLKAPIWMGNINSSDEDISVNGLENSVHVDEENGERFVYTNEDLGMITAGNSGNEENEMEEEGESVPIWSDCFKKDGTNKSKTVNKSHGLKRSHERVAHESNEVSQSLGIPGESLVGLASRPSQGNATDPLGLGKMDCVDTSKIVDAIIKQAMKGDPMTAEHGVLSCPWCSQVFTSVPLLQRHIKVHVGNYRPYACDYCPSSFSRSAHLKRHLRTHTGEKPYTCGICNKSFARQDKLKTHLERHVLTAAKEANDQDKSRQVHNFLSQIPIKVIVPSSQQAKTNGVESDDYIEVSEHNEPSAAVLNFSGSN